MFWLCHASLQHHLCGMLSVVL
uniref:Uncharacterized protein n=1 Tax=Rhizophora mucronata TaxID=61149 RepID=A0A2P2PVQ7_RHIMU